MAFGEKRPQPRKQRTPVDIVARLQRMEDLTIDSVSLDETQAAVTLFDVPDRPGIAATIFEAIASREHSGRHDRAEHRPRRPGRPQLHRAAQASSSTPAAVLKRLSGELGGEVKDEPAVAILTVKGIGIRSHTGVGLRMFKALAEAGINVEMVSTSEVRVNVVVAADKGEAGLAALKKAFADVLG